MNFHLNQNHLSKKFLIIVLTISLLIVSFLFPSKVPEAKAAAFEIGRTPFYGKVPGLDEKSRVMIWYGTNTADQSKLNTLKTYDLVILEPTIRVINVEKNQYYLESFTRNQMDEIRRGTDGILGNADDVIVLAYISVGELLTGSMFTGFTGDMTIQNGKDVGLLPANYSGPSGPLHGPNPWSYNSSGNYINVEGGTMPDGTYNAGFNGYTNISIASDYSSTGSLLTWRNAGKMPWYLDNQGTTSQWITDSRYIYGGYWKDGDSAVDKNPTYGGGYINGGDPTWIKLMTFITDKLVHDAGYDGVFLDTVDTPDPVGGAGPAISWGPRGNFAFTAKGMVELVEAIKAVDPSKVVAANRGYWYFNPDEGTSQFATRYTKAINIFLTESWYHNPYITSGSKFYDENPAFADNWNTNASSPTYRTRDNFGGFWKDYMNAQANTADGFNIIICDFMIPSSGTEKWMNQIVNVSEYMGYDVSGATSFGNIYNDAKNWLDAKGSSYLAPTLEGVHPTDLHGGKVIDGNFSDWSSETPIFNDPAGANSKGITKVFAKFVNDKFFMMVESNTTLNLSGEMIYFDNDKKGATGWQGISWPITPDARVYFENLNKVYLAPHMTGQADVFKFPVTTISNNGWPVHSKQVGTQAEFEFEKDTIFPEATMAGKEIWTWFRVANFGGSSIKFTVPGGTTTIPSAPTGLTASAGNGQVALTWNVNSGTIDGYNVYRGGIKQNSSLITGTSYTNTGLTNGTSYSFQVSAVNSAGESVKSTAVSAIPTAPTVPSAPTGLTATPGNMQVTLNWTANSGTISGYNVYRGGVKQNTSLITGTTYTNTGLTNGTSYSFQVSSVNSIGESVKSTAVSAVPIATSVITIDGSAGDWGGVSAISSGTTTVQTLKATNDASNLYLLIQGSSLNVKGQFFLNTDNNTATGFNATGWAANGSEYMIENNIVYQNVGGGWNWTNVRTLSASEFQRNNTVVEISVPLTTLNIVDGNTIRVGYLKNDSATDRLPSANASLPSYTLGGSISVPTTPSGLTATPGNGQVALNWTATAGATSYHVYRGTTKLTTTPITTTSYTNTGLTNGTSYSFQVTAVNGAGESLKSTAVSATPSASTGTITIDGSFSDWNGIANVATGTSTAKSIAVSSGGGYLYIRLEMNTTFSFGTTQQVYIDADNSTSSGGTLWPNIGPDWKIIYATAFNPPRLQKNAGTGDTYDTVYTFPSTDVAFSGSFAELRIPYTAFNSSPDIAASQTIKFLYRAGEQAAPGFWSNPKNSTYVTN